MFFTVKTVDDNSIIIIIILYNNVWSTVNSPDRFNQQFSLYKTINV